MNGDHAHARAGAFAIGVTGHRAVRLTPELIVRLAPALDAVTEALSRAVLRLPAGSRPRPWLLTALATGADQAAAAAARRTGFRVRAMLPFAPAAYREDFAPGAERDAFQRELAAADVVTALPCPRDGSAAGYVAVGKAIIAAADVLLAVWDGLDRECEPGGTAHVVALALAARVPVIHLFVDRASSMVGPAVLLSEPARAARQPFPLEDDAAYDSLLRRVLRDNPIRDPG